MTTESELPAGLWPTIQTIDWERTEYESARARQEILVAQRIAGEIGDTLVFTEHDPVFTIGLRAGSEHNLVWNSAQLAQSGIRVAKTNRGGDITYHGPGQIVAYPVVSLDRHRDLHAYLRLLEEVLIDSVAAFGLSAQRRAGKTGIWMGERKIAAIGVAVRRWVAYHGFALNGNVDLNHFGGIIPCGISASEGTVTSLQAELGRSVELSEVKQVLAEQFWKQFSAF